MSDTNTTTTQPDVPEGYLLNATAQERAAAA